MYLSVEGGKAMKERLCCDHVSWAASIGAKGDADFLEREQAREKQDERHLRKSGFETVRPVRNASGVPWRMRYSGTSSLKLCGKPSATWAARTGIWPNSDMQEPDHGSDWDALWCITGGGITGWLLAAMPLSAIAPPCGESG